MSDYDKQKVLRMPISAEMFGLNEEDSLYEVLEERFPDLINYARVGYFQIAPTEERYLDYVLYRESESDCGEYGKVRELTEREKDKYRGVFQQIIPNVDMDCVRLVEFCWYNCSEAPDYYDITKDDFYDEV